MKKKIFARQLSTLRNEKGLTQQQAANAVGITRGRLNNYEQGTREPDIDTLTALSEFYGVSVGFLIGCDESKLVEMQAAEIHEALLLLRKIKNLSPDKQKIIEILTKDEAAALREAQS